MANTKITNPELFNLGANNTAATQLPVMTKAQRIAMTGLSVGEMIFNSTTDKVEYFDGTKWYGITYEQAVLTNLSILSVAGGGAGGGYYYSGGGGAGGFLEYSGGAAVQPNGPYSIIVGKGGNDASGGLNGPNGNNSGVNATGFNQMTSIGGGGGAGGSGGTGLTGGSGGGCNLYQPSHLAGAGTSGQGFGGGVDNGAATYRAGGGGGGAGGVGFNAGSNSAFYAGRGGYGKGSAIFAAGQSYAGGGGGGRNVYGGCFTSVATEGGGTGGQGSYNGCFAVNAQPGTPGTGGGGGGGSWASSGPGIGKAGGSGIVAFKYPDSLQIVESGFTNLTRTSGVTSGGFKHDKFTVTSESADGTGTITFI